MEVHIDISTLIGLKDKVVFITGASGGLGSATAKVFTKLGSHVVIADRSTPPAPIPGSNYVFCDVTDWPSLRAAMDETVRQYGSIDVVVANAGIGEVEDIFYDEFEEATGLLKQPKHSVIEVNLKGVIDTVKLAVHHMRKQETGGAIIMTASSAGFLGEKMIPAYNAAKHGVVGLMRSMRSNSEKLNVKVNVVAPWMAESNLLHERHRDILKENGVEITDPLIVGNAIAYLAASGVNGKSLFVGRNTVTEMEEMISSLEPQWLGEENSKAWRVTNKLEFFLSKSGL